METNFTEFNTFLLQWRQNYLGDLLHCQSFRACLCVNQSAISDLLSQELSSSPVSAGWEYNLGAPSPVFHVVLALSLHALFTHRPSPQPRLRLPTVLKRIPGASRSSLYLIAQHRGGTSRRHLLGSKPHGGDAGGQAQDEDLRHGAQALP